MKTFELGSVRPPSAYFKINGPHPAERWGFTYREVLVEKGILSYP
jgi:hypothetical protein